MYQNRPQIRKLYCSTNEVKSTCVNVSVNCNISAEISRTAVQTVTKSLYGRKFYLTREEAIDKYPSVSLYKEKQLPVHLNEKKEKAASSNFPRANLQQTELYLLVSMST